MTKDNQQADKQAIYQDIYQRIVEKYRKKFVDYRSMDLTDPLDMHNASMMYAIGEATKRKPHDEMEALIEMMEYDQGLIKNQILTLTSKGAVSFDYMKELIEDKGVSPDFAHPETELRPIHIAALFGNIDMMRFLCAKHVDLTATTMHPKHKGNNFLHYVLGRHNVAAAFVALQMVNDCDEQQQQQIFTQKNNHGDDSLTYCVINPIHNGTILDLLLYSKAFDRKSRSKAIAIAVGSGNSQAVHTIQQYTTLVSASNSTVDMNLVIDFSKLQKTYEIAYLGIVGLEVEEHLIDEGFVDKQHNQFMAKLQAAGQEKCDQFLSYILRISSLSLQQHIVSNIDQEKSNIILGQISSIVYEVSKLASSEHLRAHYGNASTLRSIFHFAAYCNREDLIRESLTLFGDDTYEVINSHNSDKNSPLHFAIRANNAKMVKFLLNLGADPLLPNTRGNNALMSAMQLKHNDIANILLEANPLLINSVNAKTNDSVLQWAAISSLEHFDTLLEKGADPTATNNLGNNCLHVAIQNNIAPIIDRLLKSDYKDQLINAQNQYNKKTALHYALERGSKDNAEMLLGLGAIPTAKDNVGQTILHLAVKHNQSDIIDLLLQSSFKDSLINDVDNKGNTALYYAVMNKAEDIANKLISHGCRKNIINNDGQRATELKNAQAMYLISTAEEKNRDAQDRFNQILKTNKTVLDRPKGSVSVRHSDQIYDLYQQLDSQQYDHNKGWTPLHIAARCGHKDAVENFLKRNEFDINSRTDEKKYSVLDCCVASQDIGLIDMVAGHGDLTVDSIMKAMKHAIAHSSDSLSHITSHDNIVQRASQLDSKALDLFVVQCNQLVRHPKTNQGKETKTVMTAFADNVRSLKRLQKEEAKQQEKAQRKLTPEEMEKKAERFNERQERQLMGSEDESMQRIVYLERQAQEQEQGNMTSEDASMKQFIAQEKEIMTRENEAMDKEDVAMQYIIEQEKERVDSQQARGEDSGSGTDSEYEEQTSYDLEDSSGYQVVNILDERPIIPNSGEQKTDFIRRMDDFLILCNKEKLKDTISRIPSELGTSMKSFLSYGYRLCLRGSAMNRKAGSRVPADVDMKMIGDVGHKDEDEIFFMFKHHFGAKREDVTIYRDKKTGLIDTVQYKDDERKIDVTLYDSTSRRSSSHWIDSLEQEVYFKQNHRGQLTFKAQYVQGCYDYMKSRHCNFRNFRHDPNALLINTDAKDLLLIMAFRFTADPDYGRRNYTLSQTHQDLVGCLMRDQGISASQSMLSDIQRRSQGFDGYDSQGQKDITKSYIANFMDKSHKMDDMFKLNFLSNLRYFVFDPRTMPHPVIDHAICELYNETQLKLQSARPTANVIPRPGQEALYTDAQRGSYVGTP